jgi:hypothetical protein
MGNRPRNLRANLNRDDGIDRAGSFHNLANVSTVRLRREVLRLFLPSELKGSEGGSYDDDPYRDYPVTLAHGFLDL